MEALLSFLIILASILVIIVVFVQNPIGGGLSSDFGAAHQLGGVKKTTDFIEKATWTLAGTIMVVSIILTIKLTPKEVKVEVPEQTEQPAGAPQGDQPTK